MTRRYENPSWNQGPTDLSDFDNLTTDDMEAEAADATRRFADADTVILPNNRTATILNAIWDNDEWTYEVRQRHTAGTFRYAEHELEATR